MVFNALQTHYGHVKYCDALTFIGSERWVKMEAAQIAFPIMQFVTISYFI